MHAGLIEVPLELSFVPPTSTIPSCLSGDYSHPRILLSTKVIAPHVTPISLIIFCVTIIYHHPVMQLFPFCHYALVLRSTHEAFSHFGRRRETMVSRMTTLHTTGTLDLTPLPPDKFIVGYCQLYTVKIGSDVQIGRLIARLVAKDYTNIYGHNYGDTFSLAAKFDKFLICYSSNIGTESNVQILSRFRANLQQELQNEVLV